MAVLDRLVAVRAKLDEIARYTELVTRNSFTDDTLEELKGNAKSLCDEAKGELDLIKADIGNWGE